MADVRIQNAEFRNDTSEFCILYSDIGHLRFLHRGRGYIRFSRTAEESTVRSVELNISGMSCGHCVARVTKALTALEGLEVDNVRIGAAALRFDPARRSIDDILEALRDAGYEASVPA
jgi:copper chaperone